jgi:Flp pilus assembly protein TadG
MRRILQGLLADDAGSVAPVVGLSLIALIAVGGIAFDYARVAAMDTELQNAADQSALAAAGQLDGETGACARAAAAAAALLSNQTLFANDAITSRAVDVQNDSACVNTGDDDPIRFYQSYDQVTDTPGAPATTDADAKVVIVRVDPREAFYALTPVVGALSSGQIAAEAVASLGSGVCKVPPVMMCNPDEPDGNTDVNFDFDPPRGAGLRLVIDAADAPGNFGFLRIDDANGAREVARQLGYDNPPQGCIRVTGVETQPGDMQAVRAAFNTRFDISENGSTTCPPGGTCSPSTNARKDLVRTAATTAPGDCALTTNTAKADWHEALIPYRAPNTTPLSATNPMNATNAYPETMGYPRDLCHAVSVTGVCSSVTGNAIVGDAHWDRDAYFWVNYGWNHSTWMANLLDEDGNRLVASEADVPSLSRYDVYKWEVANPTYINTPKDVSGGYKSYSNPVCRPPGIEPTPTSTDRRRIPVAVVNCEAQNIRGHRTNVAVRKWLDVFLVEPSIARPDRTTNGDIYVEVIGVTTSGAGDTDSLPLRHDVPYLIR